MRSFAAQDAHLTAFNFNRLRARTAARALLRQFPMKRTKLDKGKLRLNAETIRMLQPTQLDQIHGGMCNRAMNTSSGDTGCCRTAQCSEQWYGCPDTEIY